MKAIIVGFILIIFAVFTAIPSPGLGWWKDILLFLKGFLPILAVLIGVFAVSIGIANLKDARAIRKEKEAEENNE